MTTSVIKKFRYPLLTVFVTILVITVISVFIPGQKNNKSADKASDKDNDNTPTISIKPLKFSQATKEFPRFALFAEKADFYQDRNEGILNNFKLVYTYDKGKKIAISGSKARINVRINEDLTMGISDSDIYCETPITAVSTSGLNFTSENLKWNGAAGAVTTDGDVSLYGANFRIDGKGMRAILKDEKIELLSHVELTISPSAVKKFNQNGLI